MHSSSHTDRAFEAELTALRDRLQRMASRADEMLANAVVALVEVDAQLAKDTAERDRIVNQDEVDIDEQCLGMLARWQPMASDLRMIFACSKMAADIERISDHAVNICERAQELAEAGYRGPYRRIPRMAEIARSMLKDAMTAFQTLDADLARAVLARDDEIDGLYHEVFKSQTERISRGEADVLHCIPVQNVAKYLEGIADHCTALAEHVIFMVHGLDVRHPGKLSR